MTQHEHIQLINDLIDLARQFLISKTSHIPSEWDGREIRQWITDTVTNQLDAKRYLTGTRRKEYKRNVLIRNI